MGGAMTWQIKAALAAVIAALAFSAGWVVKGWQASKTIAELRAEKAQGTATRAEAARIHETQTAQLESKHAQDTIYNADRLANLKTGIDIDMRAELARAERLHRDTDSRAATYRAQANADAAARIDLANLAEALDGRVTDGLRVVAKLQGRLGERDAEVAALCEQVNIERRLNADESNPACVGM
ncbi:MAG: lysis/putative Rz-like spanin [Caudoviricetes sp.]|nr:MAG: lysis/putative Rz-like spanin [Caudoviricetes sp.]